VGNEIDGSGNGSSPSNGITVPATFAHTIDSTGTYYLIVSSEYLGSFPPVPYNLNTVKRRIINNHCTVGRVSYRHNRVHRGTVIAMNWHPGNLLPNDSPINLIVSAGPKPKPKGHR
jgi:hypothetical protein